MRFFCLFSVGDAFRYDIVPRWSWGYVIGSFGNDDEGLRWGECFLLVITNAFWNIRKNEVACVKGD
jgi:hypothetical protein